MKVIKPAIYKLIATLTIHQNWDTANIKKESRLKTADTRMSACRESNVTIPLALEGIRVNLRILLELDTRPERYIHHHLAIRLQVPVTLQAQAIHQGPLDSLPAQEFHPASDTQLALVSLRATQPCHEMTGDDMVIQVTYMTLQ